MGVESDYRLIAAHLAAAAQSSKMSCFTIGAFVCVRWYSPAVLTFGYRIIDQPTPPLLVFSQRIGRSQFRYNLDRFTIPDRARRRNQFAKRPVRPAADVGI